jgi:hypothetical protein
LSSIYFPRIFLAIDRSDAPKGPQKPPKPEFSEHAVGRFAISLRISKSNWRSFLIMIAFEISRFLEKELPETVIFPPRYLNIDPKTGLQT